MRDYYEVMGVAKDATGEEIKTAYRRLAKKYHPDLNPDDKQAAEDKFKELQQAYSVLGDPEKRAAYDRRGSDLFSDGAWEWTGGVDSIYQTIFGGNPFRSGRTRGENVKGILEVELADIVAGCQKQFSMRRSCICAKCSGEGGRGDTCSRCRGSGFVVQNVNQGMFAFSSRAICPGCSGRGSVLVDRCQECNGTGRIHRESMIEVRVPAGASTNDMLRIPGMGEQGSAGSGDLFVVIKVRPKPGFDRIGNDLKTVAEVPFLDALNGGACSVAGILGNMLVIQVPKACRYGHEISIPKQGVAGGNLRVVVYYSLPELSDDQIKKVEEAIRKTP